MITLLSTVLAVPLNLKPVLVEARDRVSELFIFFVALNDVIDDSLSLHVEETNASIVSGLGVCNISLVYF